MGKNKNLTLLKEKKITQEEYNKRLKQAKETKSVAKGHLKAAGRLPEKGPARKAAVKQVKSIAKINVPRNEQDKLMACIANASDPISSYMATLINPKWNKARICDSFARKTFVFRSIRVFQPKVVLSTDSRNGKFSVCMRPTLGGTGTPNAFQVACVNPETMQDAAGNQVWNNDTQWESPGTYEAITGGTDLRIDINKTFMTSPPGGYWIATSSSPPTANDPLGVNVSPMVTKQYIAGFKPIILGNSNILLPIGTYLITIIATIAITVGAAYTGAWFLQPAGDTTVSIIDQFTPQVHTTGLAPSEEAITGMFIVTSSGVTGGNLFDVQQAWITGMDTAQNATNRVILSISPVTVLATDTYGTSAGNGIIEQIRPVGMSCLATYMGTSLQNGGKIACAYVPPDFAKTNFFTNCENQLGQAQNFETLAQLDDSYEGPIKDGAYVWWAPFDFKDLSMDDVGDSLDPGKVDYPALIISGVFEPDTAELKTVTPIRCELAIVYECVTRSTAMDTEKLVGSQAMIDLVDNMLRLQKHTMANASHMEFMKKAFTAGMSFIARNAHILKPMGALALNALM